MSVKLRDYQLDLVEKARAALRAGKRRLMIYAPTGAGKTEVGMAIIKAARDKGSRVSFIANRIGLVEQASERFYKSGIEHGVVQGSNTRGVERNVLVCSIQTLQKRGAPDAKLIEIDEAHACAASKAYRDIIMADRERVVIGLSATPFSKGLGKRYPQLDMKPLFEEIIFSVTIRDLVKQGYLVDCDIWAPSEPDLSRVKIVAGDYNEEQLAAAVDKPQLIGDIVSHWKRLGENKQTVCFATNIAHSKHIMEMFNAAGIPCEHIDCYTEDVDRRAILRRLSNGETRIVTNCAVLAEGWDEPRIEVMICARPTRSLIRWIQMSGRALRCLYAPGHDLETLEGRLASIKESGKEHARILDHSGTAARLGFPTDDLPLKLDDGKARKSNEREREEPLPKKCPSCDYLKPPKTHRCPQCGFAPEKRDDVEVVDGKLEKLIRTKGRSPEEKQRIYAELLQHARNTGKKDGWAYYACQELFGSAPRARLAPRPVSQDTYDLITHLNIRRVKRRQKEARQAA